MASSTGSDRPKRSSWRVVVLVAAVVVILAIVALLVALSQDKEGATPHRGSGLQVVAVGDSLIARYGTAVQQNLQSPPDLTLIPGSYAVGGLTTVQIQPLLDRARAQRPDAVVLSEGTNDTTVVVTRNGGSAASTPRSEIEMVIRKVTAALAADVKAITGTGAVVVYLVPAFDPRIFEAFPPAARSRLQAYLAKFQDGLRSVADQFPGKACAVDMEALRRAGSLTYRADTLHPDDAQAVFAWAAAHLRSLHKRHRCAARP